MTNSASSNQSQPDVSSPISVEARWEKPLVPAEGGEATLLVRIVSSQAEPAARRAPLDVAFVLDRSGSMAARQAVARQGRRFTGRIAAG